MIIDKIYEEVTSHFCFEYIDDMLQDRIVKYIKESYPGNYSVEVAEDMCFSIIFDTHEDLTWFILQYS